MARRPASRSPSPLRRITGAFTPSSIWPHIEEFVESGGHITIGPMPPIQCAAVAADHHNMLAALKRHDGETFNDLMHRLDHAVDLVMNQDALIDEINDR